MSECALSKEVQLLIPAEQEYTTVAGMALSGLGMLAGLDMDLLGDLRMVTSECMDCLFHQAGKPQTVCITACVKDQRLHVCFTAQDREITCVPDTLELDITRGVLETLVPQVQLVCDEAGVQTITCSMSV